VNQIKLTAMFDAIVSMRNKHQVVPTKKCVGETMLLMNAEEEDDEKESREERTEDDCSKVPAFR
jgi:hypothetical protein